MKCQIQVFTIFLILTNTYSQPNLSIDMGLGFYQPELTGFDEYGVFTANNAGEDILTRNTLFNFGVYYEFFYNARIGFSLHRSIENKDGIKLDNNSTVDFKRSINYRFFPVETFFRIKQRMELNFTLMPIWGVAKINLVTSPSQQSEDWNSFINEFNDVKDQISELDASDDMIANWFGYGSMLGFRYYLTTRMALDFKSGFMNNRYNEKNWYLRNKKVTGPKLKIDGLPIFSLKILYGLR